MSAGTATLPDDAVSISSAKVSGVVDTLTGPAQMSIEWIDIRRLNANPDNPVDRLTDDLADMAASIRSVGILDPLLIATGDAWHAADARLPEIAADDFVVLDGHRRLGGARIVAGDNPYLAPCIRRNDLVGASADVVMAVANGQRKDFSPVDEARVYKRLADKLADGGEGMSQRAIAALVGKNQSHISKRLSLLDLPAKLHPLVGTDKLSVDDAQEIAKAAAGDEKLVDKILKRPTYESIAKAANRITKEDKRAGAVTKVKAKLKHQGVKTINYPSYGDFYRSKAVPLEDIKGLDATDHIHCEGHAVAVGYRNSYEDSLKIVPVCTTPESHPGSPAAQRSKSDDAQKRKQERDRVAAAKRHDGRVTAIKTAAAKPDPELEQLAQSLMLHRLIEESFESRELLALIEVLGLTPTLPALPGEPVDSNDWQGYRDLRDATAVRDAAIIAAVIENAATGAAATRRTFVAAALLAIEDGIEGHWQPSAAAAAFLEWLPKHGHKLAQQETAALAKVKGNK